MCRSRRSRRIADRIEDADRDARQRAQNVWTATPSAPGARTPPRLARVRVSRR